MKQQDEMTIIKPLVLILLVISLVYLSSPAKAETNIVVFGDSLSSNGNRWPAILEALNDGVYVKNNAQSGLSITTVWGTPYYTVPEWFKCTGGPNFVPVKVVFWLGNNDGLYNTPSEQYTEQLNAIIDAFEARSCDVAYVLPLTPNPDKPYYHDWLERRALTAAIYAERGIDPLDVAVNWAWTTDGLHPNDFMSYLWAGFFKDALEIGQ